MSTPASASGGPSTLAAVAGLKGLGAMGLFATSFVAAISLIVQNVGTLPQAAIATRGQSNVSAVSSVSSVKLPGQAQVLGTVPFGASQVMVSMPAFTTPDAADRFGQTYGMELVGSYPAFGRYLFNLPLIRVEPADTSGQALVFFPPRIGPADINAYLTANQLKVVHWYRARIVDGESPERMALVTLPRINPVLLDGVRGIWKANIPLHIDQTRLSDWASGNGIHLISYDPATGSLLIKGPSFAPPKPVITRPPARRVVTQPVVTTPPAPKPAPQLFVTFAPATTSDVALAAIQQAGGQMVSFDGTSAIAIVNVTSGNTTAVTTLLSAVATVKCVNTTATAPCTSAPPAVIVPAITPASAPVALRILPDTNSFSGTVLLSADVQSSDGTGQVGWTLSGALATVTIGTAAATPIAGNPLAWTATINFDSSTVADGAYTLTIRIQDGIGTVTTVTRPVVVSNAKPAQPTGFAAASVPAGVALTWQQPAAGNAALYRITRDGVQLVELPIGSTSYVDATASAGAHTYQLVVVDQSGATSDAVTTSITVAAPIAVNQVTLVVRLASGEQLAADGLAGGHLILSASALQGSPALTFQYTVDGASWISVPAAVTCAAQCTADWNLEGMAAGHYRVRAVHDQLVSDEAGFIVAAATALPAPTALVATATTWGVDLHWTAPAGLIPPAYLVSRQTATGWSSLAQSNKLDYTDTSAVAGQSYSYRVQAIGSDGTAGTASEPVSITLRGSAISASATAGPAAPSGLRVIDGPGGATLVWQPVSGATGYVVERALDSAATFVPLPAVASPMFRDSAQRVGGQVFYRVRSIGSQGAGEPSAVVTGIVLPGPASTTPAPFVVASASGQQAQPTGQVDLGDTRAAPVRAGNSVVVHAGGSTAGVDRADVQKLAGTSWLTLLTLTTTVTPAGWTAASSIDLSGVGAGDLQLRAVAKSVDGGTLAVTAPATVQVVHSAPVPTALRASTSGTVVSVSWTPPASSAPLTYNVYRASGVGGYSLAASGLTAPTFDDHFLSGKVAVSYVVTATDDLGNQSAWSAPANLVTPAAWSTAAPKLQFVLPSSATLTAGDTTLVSATASSGRGISSFSFAYSPQGSSVWINLPDRFPLATGGPTIAGLMGLATWGALFRTSGLAAGNYTVRAVATDTLGHSTEVVKTLTVAASQSRGPPAADFTLNATALVGAVQLYWNAAGASYRVERSTDGAAGPFKAIGTTTSNSFYDRILVPGFAYAYRVIALGAASTTSSTVTATPLAAPSSGTFSPDLLVNVLLPAGSAGLLNIGVAPANLTPSMQAGMHSFGSAYEINATSLGSGAQVHLLDQAATLTFTLPAGLSAAQASGLAVYHWDVARGVWVAEPSTVDLASGRITATVSHFSLFVVGTGTVSGTVFEDRTGDGFTSEDTRLAGITINLYLDGGATLVFSTTSAADGTYSFGNLGPAFYTVQEVVPAGYIETTPRSVTFSVISGFNPVVDFDNFKAGTLSGSVLQDVTGNGFSVDDLAFPGVTIELLLNGATTPVATNASAIDGTYSFADLGPGSYTLREVVPVGFVLSRQPLGPIVVTSGLSSTGNDFDNAALGLTADLSVTMTGPSSAVDGSTMSFAITITNNGPHDAMGLGLMQSPFIHTKYVSLDWVSGAPLTGSLAALDSMVLSLVMRVDPGTLGGTVITSGVTVSSSTPDPHLSNNAASVSTTVADAPLSATGVNVASVEGATFDGLVATFTDPTITAVAGDFTATIDWGDITQPSDGTIIQVGPGSFSVTGSHIYLEEDLYSISVTIFDIGGSTAATTSAATVADAAFTSATGRNITATPAFSGQVASFTDADFYATITDYTVTINWGDNSTPSAGTVRQLSPQTFAVDGTHTYTAGGVFVLTVNIVDVGGSHTQAIGSATVPAADLALTKAASGTPVLTDAPFITTINVVNNGPNTATGVVLDDNLPAGIAGVTFQLSGTALRAGDGCQLVGGHLVCNIAEMRPGERVTLVVSGSEVTPGSYSDTATVTSAVFDPMPADNMATATSQVIARTANLELTKTALNPTALTDAPLYTQIAVTNHGPQTAFNVVVVDALPAGLTSVGATISGSFQVGDTCVSAPAGHLTCTIAILRNGETVFILVAAIAVNPGQYTDTATAISDVLDPNPANNTAYASTAVTDGDLSATGVNIVTTEGAANFPPAPVPPTFMGIVANINDANPNGVASDFTATINWGDSPSTSAGTIGLVSPGHFSVTGSHTYMEEGTYTISVAITDVAGPTASTTSTARVADAPILAANAADPLTLIQGVSFTADLAGFGDANFSATLGDWSATIDWGDGTPISNGTISQPGPQTFTVSGTHTFMTTGTFTYTVNFVDVGGTRGQVTGTAIVQAPADLAVTKTGPATANVDTDVVYHVLVTNNGPLAAQNVHLLDTVPVGLSLVGTAGFDAGDPSSSSCLYVPTIDCSAGTLGVGATFGVTLTFHVSSSTADGTVITNTATAISNTLDTNTANNSASVSTTMVGPADLSIVKTGPATGLAGSNLTYTITVVNNGPSAATNVIVSDVLPNHTTLVSFVQDTGPSAGTTLPAGGTMTFTLIVTVAADTPNGSVIHNTASVSSPTFDANLANNSSTVDTTILNNAELRIVKTGPATALAGSNVTYSIAVVNNGPSAATNVIVSDVLPNHTTLVSFVQDTGPSAGTTLPAGGTMTFTLVVTVAADTPNGSVIHNTASVSSPTFDANLADNSSTVDTTVISTITATGTAVTAVEGANFIGQVATFTASDLTAIASDFAATITWGDGSASSMGTIVGGAGTFGVNGSHTYGEEGSFTISVVVTAGGQTATAGSTATVADAALTATGLNFAATEGASFSGAVASFTDANPNATVSDFSVTITWGDTSSSSGTVVANGSGGFTVNATHTYTEEGSYLVSITIIDAGGSSATVRSTAAVADASLQATGLSLPATRFTAFAGVVATFTDADPGGVASDYIATITWGDGTTSIGNVLAAGGAFAVSASHVFGEGRFTITTTIVDAGGATAVATTTITVDLTAPVTTPTVDGTLGHNGWWSAFEGPGVLTLTATDNLTGVVVTYYTINGGVPQVYTGPISLDEGKYVIRFWSIDAVGNVETAHTIRIKVREGHIEEDRDGENGGQDNGDGHTEARS